MTHNWSGWPGAWCLDCGIEDPHETALADGDFIEVPDSASELGFRYEFPNVKLEPCPEPGSGRFNHYKSRHHLKIGDTIKAREGCLAHFCGDIDGTVEQFDGDTILCRMRRTGKLTPFRRDQLDHIARSS